MTAMLTPAAADPALPMLEAALDASSAGQAIAASKHYRHRRVEVLEVRLRRHKPGKRAVIDYTLAVTTPGIGTETVPVIAKMRARRAPRTAYQRAKAVWARGFQADSADGISVPEPLGTVPALGLWLQRRVAGLVATDLLPGRDGEALARRVADAAVKLHLAGVPAERRHGATDEMAILHRVLSAVAAARADLTPGIHALLAACDRVARTLDGPSTGIHRDFYADQIIVSGERLHLLDFDLYCEGHAALDAGNFAGHLAEHALRTPAHRDALDRAERSLEDQYMRHAGAASRRQVRAYAALTLARHVYLSTVVPGREATTTTVLAAALARAEALLDGR